MTKIKFMQPKEIVMSKFGGKVIVVDHYIFLLQCFVNNRALHKYIAGFSNAAYWKVDISSIPYMTPEYILEHGRRATKKEIITYIYAINGYKK